MSEPSPAFREPEDQDSANADWVILGGATTPPWDEGRVVRSAEGAAVRSMRRGARRGGPEEVRRRLADWVAAHPPEMLSLDEIRAQFQCMPERYWQQLAQADLLWHLNTIHCFLRSLVTSDSAEPPITVDWKKSGPGGLTHVVVCSWDRQGLLEKVAAAFGALRIAIRRADVYTRNDSLVLDVFEVSEPDGGPLGDENRLSSLPFLVEGAFSQPPRFASVWATEFHKHLPQEEVRDAEVRCDNRKDPRHTLLRVSAPDRLGLLYDLLHALAESDLQIVQALIETEEGIAHDQFLVTDSSGRKLVDPSRIRRLRKSLVKAATASRKTSP